MRAENVRGMRGPLKATVAYTLTEYARYTLLNTFSMGHFIASRTLPHFCKYHRAPPDQGGTPDRTSNNRNNFTNFIKHIFYLPILIYYLL